MSAFGPNGPDPRASDDLSLEPQRPMVARGGGGLPWLAIGGAVLAGMVVFFWMTSHRPGPPKEVRNLAPSDAYAQVAPPSPPPPELDAAESAARNPPPVAGVQAPPPPPAVAVVTPPPAPVVLAAPPPANSGADRRKAPTLVVDFGGSEQSAKAAGADKGPASTLNNDEQFAARVSTDKEPERARATLLRDRGTVIAQGAVIPAVLETALDSDLPGFTRAVVSRDVRSFDGSTVLVPRGSRVIGQYKSGLALGASRAFVIWTRILRPDGASIQIGSPGTDDLGRAGFAGSVDRHFFERFSGAVLLSVLNIGVAAAAQQPSTQVVVGSSADAGALASSASAFQPQNIPPTIKVPQGSPILIFVAKDLDFTPVETAK
ncbi:TrbI/VirB10 family protein [Caulobacter sp. S45]|uniref:TrbI/VirB10 family protein n=1 Tax=Caulobacter sp. S45 TaxID=1641861 RepID=UPI001C207FCA|nr:TrbI/VirB10 family protein [Caulobacter sp. S45]